MTPIVKNIKRLANSLLVFGVLFAFCSSFGQTFFVSLFVPTLQDEFALSETTFSSLYAIATLGSAFTLTWAGSFIDRVRLTKFSFWVIVGLSAALLLLSVSMSWHMLVIALFGMRLFGQGLMSHTAITSMAKFFIKSRGKAISVAAIGHPLGEAVLPIATVSLLSVLHWRGVIVVWIALVVLLLPVSRYLLFKKREFSRLRMIVPKQFSAEEKKQSKPYQILKTKAFWIIAPVNFATASVGTAFIFFQLKLGETRGWDPEFIAFSFSAYAVGNFCSALLSGWLTDIFSAKRIFPFYLVPFSLGLVGLAFVEQQWIYVLFILSIGVTNGFGATVKNAVLAEIFGTTIVGSVRSLFITVMVFSTALGPIVFGYALDAGFTFYHLSIAAFFFFVFVTINALRIYLLKPVVGEAQP